MTSLPVRETRRRESWRALQNAAIELVRGRGFAAITVDDIAAAAGVSRRTFFNHFPTKAAALFDPDPEDAERLQRLLEEVDGTEDVWGSLRDVWLGYLEGHRHLIAVRRRLTDDPELLAYQTVAYRHVDAWLAAWLRRQLPDDAYLAALLSHVSGGVVGAAFAVFSPDDPVDGFLAQVERGFALIDGAVLPAHRA